MKVVLLICHFRHLNPILCSIFLKDFCPQRKFIFSVIIERIVIQFGRIFSNMNVLLTTHISKSSMITFLSGFRVLFFPALCRGLSLFLSLLFFIAGVTDAPQYFAILSSARQTGKITLFSTASSLHRRFVWFITSLASLRLILSSFPLVGFCYVFSL